jgi:D-3-phosphoglycerate dehydrogenase
MVLVFVNCARGGVIEVALVKALDSGKCYLLDWMFLKRPTPEMTILMNPKISLTTYGAATGEAQDRLVLN